MATKVNLMKLLQEIRGLDQIGRRPFPSRPPALGWLHLRLHTTTTALQRRRGLLSIHFKDPYELPHPVKIKQATVQKSGSNI